MNDALQNLPASAGARLRAALAEEKPLQVIGTINAYHARRAARVGYRAIYLAGGGVAAGSLGLPDLGISGLDDVLTDVRRITDACPLPLLVDARPSEVRFLELPPGCVQSDNPVMKRWRFLAVMLRFE